MGWTKDLLNKKEKLIVIHFFKSGRTFYYIDVNEKKIKIFIIHSGLSPESAYIFSLANVLYEDYNTAQKAFDKYFSIFK